MHPCFMLKDIKTIFGGITLDDNNSKDYNS